MKHFILLLSFCISLSAFAAAVQGKVTDSESHEPLAFVAMAVRNTHTGTYTDIDGNFSFTDLHPGDLVVLNYVGYESKELIWNGENPWNIQLKYKTNALAEVVIRPGVNPAEIIIKKAIENKTINDPETGHSFTYDSYNKLVFSPQLDSSIMYDPAKYNSLDSNSREVDSVFKEQYLFLMESVSQRKFLPPAKSEETIIATRVSGLTSPEFSLLSTQLQSFSFYGEIVNILDISYLSPLANGSVKKYLFIIEDTTFIQQDTVYTISFRPRKGKNFTGMKGQLFINTNGYAIQNVIAEPFEPISGFNIRIQQQYEWIENRKWFPMQLNSFIDMPFASMENFKLVGIAKSYIKNLKLDVDLKRSEFTPVTLQMLPLASHQPDSVWNKYRDGDYGQKELKTYHVLDSVGKAENLDMKVNMLTILSTGKIPWGPISFDLDRLMRANSYEGFRLGLGVHTNDRLSPHYAVGGYYAYGFKDVHSKYGGDVRINIKRKREIWIKALYENDVREFGGFQMDKPAGANLLLSNVYPLFISRMDRIEKKELQFNGRMIGNLSANFFTNVQFVRPFADYQFLNTSADGVNLYTREFTLNETGVSLRWAPGEKLARMGSREIRLGGRFPVVYFKMSKGGLGYGKSDFDYERYDLLIEKRFKIKNVGELTVVTVAGMMPSDVPMSLLYNARGTYGQFTIATPLAFETMRTNEFIHNQYAAIHIRHNFKTLLLKTDNFAPQFQLVHSMMWGKLDQPNVHSFASKAAQLGYFESGIQIDGILKSGFSALGIGTFYRYGPYHLSSVKENFAFKLTSTFNF